MKIRNSNLKFKRRVRDNSIVSCTNTFTNERAARTASVILDILIKSPDVFISKDRLCEEVWGYSDFFIRRNFDVQLNSVRKVLRRSEYQLETRHGKIRIFKIEP